MSLPPSDDRRPLGADGLQKPAPVLSDVFRGVALERSQAESVFRQRADAAQPGAEGVREPCLFQRFADDVGDAGGAGRRLDVALAQAEGDVRGFVEGFFFSLPWAYFLATL